MRKNRNTSQEAEFARARDYAFLLLKFRLRSEAELIGRLKQKKFSEVVCRRVVAFLKEKRFLDDEEFARSWISSRIKRPLGLRRLKRELKAKGVDSPIIEEQLRVAARDYNEKEVIEGLVSAKLKAFKSLDPLKARKRVFGFLLRRGFSADAALEVLNRL